MINNQIVKNYAIALFAGAVDKSLEDKVFEEITAIDGIINESMEIKDILLSPITTYAEKMRVVAMIEKVINIETVVKQFLLTLIKHSRMSILPKIRLAYSQLLNERKNIKMVKVVSSKNLDTKEKEWITDYLEKELQKKVVIEYSSDQAIIGGLVIKYDSIIRDYSILGTLGRISKIMQETRINWNIG